MTEETKNLAVLHDARTNFTGAIGCFSLIEMELTPESELGAELRRISSNLNAIISEIHCAMELAIAEDINGQRNHASELIDFYRSKVLAYFPSIHEILNKHVYSLNEEQTELIEAAKEALKKGVNVLNEALIGTDQAQELQTLDLNTLLYDLKKQYGHQRPINIYSSVKPFTTNVVAIERILVNILSNAAKYTPIGTEINIYAIEQSNQIMISIMDNGPGFPSDNKNLFELYSRGTAAEASSSFGIGLASCKMLCEKLGGTISAKNRKNKSGAVFNIILPRLNSATASLEKSY